MVDDAANNVLTIKNTNQKSFCAFGDDSIFKETIVFSFVVFPRNKLEFITSEFQKIKKSLGISADNIIHMSELSHPEARKKAGLDQIDESKVAELISQVSKLLNKHGSLHYGVSTGEMPEKDDEFNVIYSPKGIISLLIQSCFQGANGIPANDCDIYVEKDDTRIHFLGEERKRAYRFNAGFSDIGAPGGKVFHIEPEAVKKDFHPLMQMADIFAYVCSHGEAKKNSFWGNKLRKIKSFSKSTLQFAEV